MKQPKILITGANGFIGRELCKRMAPYYQVIAFDVDEPSEKRSDLAWEKADIGDYAKTEAVLKKHSPDVVIHCAGIAHQKISAVDRNEYLRVNSEATEHLAKAGARQNSSQRFVFLSSISIYGERNLEVPVVEDSLPRPSGDYAYSKLDAENRLLSLAKEGILKNLTILRLAPVYDFEWSLNLDRRVFAPKKSAYLVFGRGKTRISALARPNLVEFIYHLIGKQTEEGPVETAHKVYNVCDSRAYSFKEIIDVFRKSKRYPGRIVIPVPLLPVRVLTWFMGLVFRQNRDWWHACYDKLTSDLVFDNQRMLATGFRPPYSLGTIFLVDRVGQGMRK